MIALTFTEQQRSELRHERYHHPHPRVQMKMEALLLKSYGLPHHQIATCVGVSEPTLRRYFTAYRDGGIDALRQRSFYRPKSDLVAHYATLEAHFMHHPPANARQAAAAIEQLTGLKRSPTPIRTFLKYMGLKRVKTYAVPAKVDADTQEMFKKKTLNPV